jgi:salicylate hydroxylase
MGKLLIVGGGLGGLAAALACARVGEQLELFERGAQFSEVGAGIQLGPNVVKVLHAWGLQQALADVAAFPDRLQVRSATSGGELGVLRLGSVMAERYGAPYVTIHRADMQNVLLDAVHQQSGVQLHLNSRVTGFSQDESGVHALFADQRQVQGDLMVGADGGWSQIRQQLLSDGVPQPTGQLAYRAMVSQSSLPESLRSQQVTAWLGPKLHVVQYPVHAGEWLNVVAIVHGQVKGDLARWDHNANAMDLQKTLSEVCAPLKDLICTIPNWRLWGLSIRAPMQGAHQHAKGRVALLGDAAHPMVPYLAQGAGMAIEDAGVLAQVLIEARVPGKQRDVPELLLRYAQRRWQRNARVQARAIRNGKIFHATGLMRWGRDASMKLLGEPLLDVPWLYAGAMK